MTFPLNLYSINSILPHLSLICQNKFFFSEVYISSGFSFLFFYPLKLVTGFANVTSFKLKSHDSLFYFKNTFKFVYGDHSLSHVTHLLSFLLFIHFFHTEYPLLIETSLLRTYVFFFIIIYFYLRGFTNLLTINQDIIKVNDYKLTNKSTQHMIYQSHKSTRCISKSKRHNQPLIQTIFSFKNSFSFIPFFHPNLMITTFKINF